MGNLLAVNASLSALRKAAAQDGEPAGQPAAVPSAVTDLVLWSLWVSGIDAPRYELESRHELVRMELAHGGKSIARIQVRDLMMKGRPLFRGTSTVEVSNVVRHATADPNVSSILLEIDSPGGMTAGVDVLARDVIAARKKKPVWASIDDLGASSAYWVASQADLVYATSKTALIGSIGTLLTVYDESKAAAAQGVEALVFSTGPLKGAGMVPGAPVTEEQRAHYQGIVNASQEHFDNAVRTGRNMTAAELAAVRTGGVFPATRALELKLIDGIQSLDKTLGALANAR